MPLNIPIGHHLSLTEMVCGACSNEYYVTPQPGILLCPFCGKNAYQNGDIHVYTKHSADNCPQDKPDEEEPE